MELRISVVIPTYRRVNQTIHAVKSVLGQTEPVFEIVIVQDEISSALSDELKKEHLLESVKLIQIDHTGIPAKVRNVGIDNSSGDWIGFLDSDDTWLPDKLKQQSAFIKKLNLDCVSTSNVPSLFKKEKSFFEVRLSGLLKSNFVINSSVLVKRDKLMEIGGIPENQSLVGVEDYAAWLRLCNKVKWVHFLGDLVVYEDSEKDRLSFELRKSLFNSYFAIISLAEWRIDSGKKIILFRLMLKLLKLSLLTIRR
jgi:glycosyltransferase involved in cell wall biosynthesis